MKTGAVALEVEKINTGKLAKDGEEEKTGSLESKGDIEEKAATFDKCERNNTSCSQKYDEVEMEPNQHNQDQVISNIEKKVKQNHNICFTKVRNNFR